MAAHFASDSILVQNGGASVTGASFFPILPNGASIGQVFVDLYQSGSVAQGVATQAASLSYIAQVGGIATDSELTVNSLTGVATTLTKIGINTLAWTSGVFGTPPQVVLGITAGIPANDYYVIQYNISYD